MVVSNDDLFRRSTQYRFWSFTRPQLAELRIVANKKGIQKTEERINELDEFLPEAKLVRENQDQFQFVHLDEEKKLISYYARRCKELAAFFHLSAQVRSTAIMYLYKFYLYHSVMEYHPGNIMLTCLFLAAKVENHFIGINTFCKNIPKTTPEAILKNEYLILETMKFSLQCHHPFQPLYGFFLDIQQTLPKLDFNRLGKNYDGARELVNESLFTDLPFLYTPPQIALACLWLCDDVLVEKYLSKKFGLAKKTEQEDEDALQCYNKIMVIIRHCADVVRNEALDPSQEESKTISAKIKLCLEPIRFGRKLMKQNGEQAAKRSASITEGGDEKRVKLETE
ncbi:hypothetical protein KL933_002235 [Ogataea haglerorum]|uniref:Cyclin-like domain-containing protein n=1 Tax=Ogataea haglerorum TaxID=1937702 RepID=A0AAN6D6N0_9ASCO|nr:uncharacterized protein KL911_002865 [Ogataea haglerorum]KAG7694158.1 hypothetical protein KL915_003829 [Ogataea haglerorum]KAG7694859.1 hypothetical protein KL951_004036 [Ogataea haglerorum]KAG7728109.1 hypothetical protein KL933_002235 [Ogataea haglerorum]KAG7738512.1 hypothetical protein KL923_003209 [Ogataea haglerorum]KAG7747744.1 hypothetical protein KL912_003116 [Ogataea haglerorum]